MRRSERRAAAERGRSERAAGFVTIAVPRMSSFLAGVRSPGAYFLTGSVSSVPVLYWGSSARVVRDVRRAFGLTSGDSYDTELGDRLFDAWRDMQPSNMTSDRWTQIGDDARDAWRTDEVVPLEALRTLVWRTYLRTSHPEGREAVLFTRDVGIPRVGASIGDVDASVNLGSGEVNANAWPFNPFSGENPRGGEPVYNPWCASSAGCDPYDRRWIGGGKKPGGFLGRDALPALAVLGLIAMAGSAK